ncbi:DUF4145 domain-containing protein [Streptomyces californicus]|uniref:DUF4145 domain-containing protein n=1 Tax=Streptomyces californicus TaxID=67351 RepID=UPI003401823A
MDVAKLVLEYVKVLAWPAFAASLLWILRSKIKEVVDRLTRVETPAGSAEFAAAAAHVLDEVEETALSSGIASVVVGDAVVDAGPQLPAADPEASEKPATKPREDMWPTPERRGAALYYAFDHPIDLAYLTPDARAAHPTSLLQGPFGEAMATVTASPRAAVVEAWLVLESLCLEALAEYFNSEVRPANPASVMSSATEGLKRLGLPPSALNTFSQLRNLRNRAVHSGEAITRSAAEDFVRSCHIVARHLARAQRQRNQGSSGPP